MPKPPSTVPSLPAVPSDFQGYYLLEIDPIHRSLGQRWVGRKGSIRTGDLTQAQVYHTKKTPIPNKDVLRYYTPVSAREALAEAQARLDDFARTLRDPEIKPEIKPAPERSGVHPTRFGRDHWSTLAYAFSCLGNGGQLNREQLREDGIRHPTRLFGHTELNPKIVPDHSDLDCLRDLEAAGILVNVGSGIFPRVRFTEAGLKLGQWLCAVWGTSGFSSSRLDWSTAVTQSGALSMLNPAPPTEEGGE